MSHAITLLRTVARSATTRLPRSLMVLAIALGLLGLTTAGSPRTASADDWCWADPIVSINGHTVQILTGVNGSPEHIKKHVQGATVTIYVPDGVDTKLIATYSPLYPETTVFKKIKSEKSWGVRDWKKGDPIPVVVEVDFKATKKLPAAVQVKHSGRTQTTTGSTDREIETYFVLR
jgi:hypothetical protein